MPIELSDIERIMTVDAASFKGLSEWAEKAGISTTAIDGFVDAMMRLYVQDSVQGMPTHVNMASTIYASFKMGWEIRDQIGRG